ncbi:Uncharacterised protein [Streptococcus equi subsp. equi]|nr:Uncharacterised protein [Streptococcus equi subsp. equi]
MIQMFMIWMILEIIQIVEMLMRRRFIKVLQRMALRKIKKNHDDLIGQVVIRKGVTMGRGIS